MRRRFLILLNILFIIMASLSVQCKAENGNGGSTDEESAFPQSLTVETPAAVKPAEASQEETACDLIEKIFHLCAEDFTRLQKGKELFSPDNDLPFFFIGRSSLVKEFEQLRSNRPQKLKEFKRLRGSLPITIQQFRSLISESERIFLQPRITIGPSDDYYLLNFFRIKQDALPAATIACRRDACEDLYQKLNRQDSGLACMRDRYFFYNDWDKRVVEFGTVEQNPRVWTISPYKETLNFLVQAGTTIHKRWLADDVVYDGETTMTLRPYTRKGMIWRSKRKPIHLKLYCKSQEDQSRPCVLPEPQKMFYEYTAQMAQADLKLLPFEEKPKKKNKSKTPKIFRKRGKRLPEGSALT